MNTDGVRDPFAGQDAHVLGFLNTPLSMPAGTAPVLRGSSRLFEPAHRAGANVAAQVSAAAGSAAATDRMSDVVPTPDVTPPVATNLYGVDLTTLTVEQLGRLMTACATQMMHSVAGAARRQEP